MTDRGLAGRIRLPCRLRSPIAGGGEEHERNPDEKVADPTNALVAATIAGIRALQEEMAASEAGGPSISTPSTKIALPDIPTPEL
jgi:hypothetical protein